MKTVIAIYIVAILALAGGLVYIDKSLNSIQVEDTSAVTACEDNWHAPLVPCVTPLVVPDSGREIVSTEAYQGGTGYGVDDLQQATVTIE